MKHTFLALLAFLTLFTSASCRKITGEGPVVTEMRNISGFNSIHSELSADVYFTPGSSYEVGIEAQRNIIDEIETVLNDGKLTIRVKRNVSLRSHERIRVNITAPDINEIYLSGSGNIYVTNTFTTGNLNLKISGSGSMSIPELEASSLTAAISGSGDMTIGAGHTGQETLEISGSGNIDALGCAAGNSSVRISGSGNIRVFATETLKVKISGSGDVYYKGNPALDVDISGSGKLKHL